jgi:hypothetical protein
MRDIPSPALIISNHTTDIDPALVGMSFPKPMVFVASEHVYRFGFASRLLRFLFRPLLRVKGKTDARVVKQILNTLRAGRNVCLFAEGNRSFSGLTRAVFPATGKLARNSGASLITYRIEGGYFAAPRWAAKMRKGPLYGAPVNVYSPRRLKEMTADEVTAAIQRDIHEDAYARQLENPRPYRGKNLAQNIETALYLCPSCGKAGTLRSSGNSFGCGCGLSGQYDAFGMLSGVGLEFTTVRDWFAWQQKAMAAVVEKAGAGAICHDDGQQLFAVVPGVAGTLVATGEMTLYRDRLVCAGQTFALGDIGDFAIIGQRTLIFATLSGAVYEIKSAAPRSAAKYQRAYEILRGRSGE